MDVIALDQAQKAQGQQSPEGGRSGEGYLDGSACRCGVASGGKTASSPRNRTIIIFTESYRWRFEMLPTQDQMEEIENGTIEF